MLTLEQLEHDLEILNRSISDKKSLEGKSRRQAQNHARLYRYLTDPVAIAALNQNIGLWQAKSNNTDNELSQLIRQEEQLTLQIAQYKEKNKNLETQPPSQCVRM